MGDTEGPARQPEPAAECPAALTLRDTYYRPLVRLAALLTGDADVAEAVARDALAGLTGLRPGSPLGPGASADELRYLQQRVLVRSRRSRHPGATPRTRQGQPRPRPPVRADTAGSSAQAPRAAADFARLPVVRALQELPRRWREAVVLTHYLDLSEQQAAVVAGVTPTALRRFLNQAMRALADPFPDA